MKARDHDGVSGPLLRDGVRISIVELNIQSAG
jgi:hypothetical protein